MLTLNHANSAFEVAENFILDTYLPQFYGMSNKWLQSFLSRIVIAGRVSGNSNFGAEVWFQ